MGLQPSTLAASCCAFPSAASSSACRVATCASASSACSCCAVLPPAAPWVGGGRGCPPMTPVPSPRWRHTHGSGGENRTAAATEPGTIEGGGDCLHSTKTMNEWYGVYDTSSLANHTCPKLWRVKDKWGTEHFVCQHK